MLNEFLLKAVKKYVNLIKSCRSRQELSNEYLSAIIQRWKEFDELGQPGP